MQYRLGWPLGKVIARMGVPTVIRIFVIKDEEAGVFVGTSRDLPGLVVEADSLEAILDEARAVIPDLLDGHNGDHHHREEIITSIRYSGCPAHA